MRFDVLGPLQVRADDGSVVDVRGSMRRALLAALLLNAGSVVSADRLSQCLWGDRQAGSSATPLYNQVMRLRQSLGAEGERIKALPPGYLIEIGPGELDVAEFERLCSAGWRALTEGEWEAAASQCAAALALWRGEPLADVSNAALYQPWLLRIGQLRLQATEWRITADLNCGRYEELIPELSDLVHAFPLREALHESLMLALARSGRQAEALAAYQDARRLLVAELGIEPGASLRQLHQLILSGDAAVLAAPAGVASTAGTASTASTSGARPSAPGDRTPNQLPADVRTFTGRGRELERLLAEADEARQGTEAGMVVISAIDGMAGIGKSALAIHAAHRLGEWFPDGRLFVDLRGFTPDQDPMTPEEALGYLLRSLDVAPRQIPRDLGERAAYYRSRLAGTKTLILLDNAANSAQVRPLLPGAPGCLVLITSRAVLSGLDDASLLSLDALPDEDAIALLHKVAGPGRGPEGDPAIAELIALCGNMPLPIRIAAASLRHPGAPQIAALVAQLRDGAGRLERLRDDERNLTALFDASYGSLDAGEQHMFRCIARVPGPDVDVYAAANLAGLDLPAARRVLESLLDQNLLVQHAADRYRMHDLLRSYATGLEGAELAAQYEAARGRLLDYYLCAADAAVRHLDPTRTGKAGPGPAASQTPVLSARADALAWMQTEQANLVAAVGLAAATDPLRAIALVGCMGPFLLLHGPWTQAAALHRKAADLAAGLGERELEAEALFRLARIMNVSGQLPVAAHLCEQALERYAEVGALGGQANALCELGRIKHVGGDLSTAAELIERAVAIFRDTEDLQGEATALIELGRVRQLFGQAEVVVGLLQRALELLRRTGYRLGEANTLIDLAYALMIAGGYAQAAEYAGQAQAIYQSQESAHGEANALGLRGQILVWLGDHEAAGALYQRKLEIDVKIGFRQGEAIALWGLGHVGLAAGDLAEAAGLFQRSYAIFEEGGYALGQADALHGLARTRSASGDHDGAATILERSLAMFRDSEDVQNQAAVLNSIGALTHETGQARAALDHHRQALELAREASSPLDEARALDGVARCLETLGERDGARRELGAAVKLYRQLGVPEAGSAAERLSVL
ncbi:tetratricopeptide repeat protein [Actinospica durhamensis]|uniref:Tetratricopeptide repeat protein n=1 Tax=Actinospica durhamensis TaxID=1508375 RepID=A0A941IW13_9ACTN|nr:AfsR/SARP family transcriptional regulator [Actinospica durhamensis]MBR7838241.1 tetratricopeptide repeat protein [Actinospica durhamensis]